MKRISLTIAGVVLLAMCLIWGGPIAASAETQAQVEKPVASGPVPADTPAEQLRSPRRDTALNTEIRAAIEAEKLAVASIRTELAEARTDLETVALHQQIAQIKQGTEVQILMIQAAHARLDGHQKAAQDMDAIVEQLAERYEARFGEKLSPHVDAVR